jgi:hypothetical protein
MSTRLALALLALAAASARAQTHPPAPRVVAYVEAYGNTAALALSTEVAFASGLLARVGVASADPFGLLARRDDPIDRQRFHEASVDASLVMTSGYLFDLGGGHGAEASVGFVAGVRPHPLASSKRARPLATATLGYRYAQEGGWLVRLGFTPVWADGRVRPAFGLSVGHDVARVADWLSP